MKYHKDYKDMKENIVIFICSEDYYGYRDPVYRFETRDIKHNLKLDEKRITILVNPDSDTKSNEIKAFLKYVKEGTVTDTFTQEIEDTVVEIKDDQDFRGSYMTLEEKLKDLREDGMQEGIQKGIQENREEMCKKLMEQGVALSIISNVSGLTKEEILKLKTN